MKKKLIVFLLVSIILSMTGCEILSDHSESDETITVNISDISSAVALDTPGGFAYIKEGKFGLNDASIKIYNDLIYVKSTLGETENFVSCFQIDGTKRWEIPFERWDITVYPLQDGSCLLRSGGELFHVNQTGEIDWQTQQYSEIKSCMVQPDGTILYLDGEYFGKVLPDGSLEQISSAPTRSGIFIPFSDGSFCIRSMHSSELYNYDASGKELWSYSANYSIADAVKTSNGSIIAFGTINVMDLYKENGGILRLLDKDGNLLKEQQFENDPINSVQFLNDDTIAVHSDKNVYLLDASFNVLKEIPVDSSIPSDAINIFSRGLTVLDNGGFAVHYASAVCEANLGLNTYAILRVYQYNKDGDMVDKLHCTFDVESAFPDIFIDESGRIFYENPPGITLQEV